MRVTAAVAGPAKAVGVEERQCQQIGHAADPAWCIVQPDLNFGTVLRDNKGMGDMPFDINGGQGHAKLLVHRFGSCEIEIRC